MVLVSGFGGADCTILEKLKSGFFSNNCLASGYVRFLVTFILMISFSFFHVEHSFDLDK